MDKDRLNQILQATCDAAPALAQRGDAEIQALLNRLADKAMEAEAEILEANAADLGRMDPANPRYDRLLLSHERLRAICDDLRNVAGLPSPVGEILEERTLDNGLELQKVRVPIGVIAVIFESRPNVTLSLIHI